MKSRKATIARETKETKIRVEINLDGKGDHQINTGIAMLDHLLSHIARHGLIDIIIEAHGDLKIDQHHTTEDIAICLGQALRKAVGEGKGITRMAHAIVPMDEALAIIALDFSGRGYPVIDESVNFKRKKVGSLESDLIGHFLESLAAEARINLHAGLYTGSNDHHKAEALFKALGRALGAATRIEPRIADDIPSTKGVIEN